MQDDVSHVILDVTHFDKMSSIQNVRATETFQVTVIRESQAKKIIDKIMQPVRRIIPIK